MTVVDTRRRHISDWTFSNRLMLRNGKCCHSGRCMKSLNHHRRSTMQTNCDAALDRWARCEGGRGSRQICDGSKISQPLAGAAPTVCAVPPPRLSQRDRAAALVDDTRRAVNQQKPISVHCAQYGSQALGLLSAINTLWSRLVPRGSRDDVTPSISLPAAATPPRDTYPKTTGVTRVQRSQYRVRTVPCIHAVSIGAVEMSLPIPPSMHADIGTRRGSPRVDLSRSGATVESR